MGIKERKAKEKEELKQLILDAAVDLLERDGFEALSIRKIAERVEYAPATIYLYYRDKDELLYEIHNVGFDRFLLALRECLVGSTARERLHIMGRKYIEFGLANPQLYSLMFIVPEPIKEENLVNFDGWEQGFKSLDFLSSVLEQAMAEGTLPPGDLNTTKMAFWTVVHGCVALHNSLRLSMIPEEHRIPSIYATYERFYELVMQQTVSPKA